MGALLAELGRQHSRVERAWRRKLAEGEAGGSGLAAPLEWRFGEALPALSDVVVFLAVSHEAMHLGQLAAWRRARGLPSALNSL